MVKLGSAEHRLEVSRGKDGIKVWPFERSRKAEPHILRAGWKPGDLVWTGTVDDVPVAVQVRPVLNGFDLAHRGFQARAYVYTEPEAASVGLTEQEARDKGYAVKIGTFQFRTLAKAAAINERDGFVKVVAETRYDELLGVHIIGPHATEIIHECIVALHLESTAEELGRAIHAHPTVSEAIMEAAEGIHGLTIHF